MGIADKILTLRSLFKSLKCFITSQIALVLAVFSIQDVCLGIQRENNGLRRFLRRLYAARSTQRSPARQKGKKSHSWGIYPPIIACKSHLTFGHGGLSFPEGFKCTWAIAFVWAGVFFCA